MRASRISEPESFTLSYYFLPAIVWLSPPAFISFVLQKKEPLFYKVMWLMFNPNPIASPKMLKMV